MSKYNNIVIPNLDFNKLTNEIAKISKLSIPCNFYDFKPIVDILNYPILKNIDSLNLLANQFKDLNFDYIQEISNQLDLSVINKIFDNADLINSYKDVLQETVLKMNDLNISEDYPITNINYEDYTDDILEQLESNVRPQEIAYNLQEKTGIDYKWWLPFIVSLISLLYQIIAPDTPVIQENHYHFDIDIHEELEIQNDNLEENFQDIIEYVKT